MIGLLVSAALAALSPAEAMALADKAVNHGVSGRYEMTVASTGRGKVAQIFLNSTDNFRRPDNVTFTLSPAVGVALRKRYGMPPEAYFQGKHVVVDGQVFREVFAKMIDQRPHDFARYNYNVRVERLAQIVVIE